MGCRSVQAYRDGHRDTDEKHEGAEVDMYSVWLVTKLMVQTPGQSTAKSERQSHACEADTDGWFPVAHQVSHVHFESDQEEEEHKSKICDEVEIGDGSLGENGICESRYTTHY